MRRHKKLEWHGFTAGGQPPEYQIWAQIVQRCTNPRHPKWKRYGGRGIKLCDRWRRSFRAFLEDVGSRPKPGHSIDRIDNDKGYVPGNVRWIPMAQQARNSSRNRIVEYDGHSWVLAELAEYCGVDRKILRERLERGLSVREAISRPVEGGNLYYMYRGKCHSLSAWSKILKISYSTLYHRLKSNWTVERIFGTPSVAAT